MDIDGIIFDLDGTLWDSCRVVSESWARTLRRVCGAERGPGPEQIRSIMGMTAEQIADRLFPQYGERSLEICMQCIHGENEYIADHCGDLYPGIRETLAALSRRMPLFIVSNCLTGYIECFLTSSGLGPYFRDYVCAEDTGLTKAGNIALIAERNGVSCPAYVGDTVMDEESAREADCVFIHAAYGFGGAARPDAVIRAPMELPAVIETLKGGASHA